MKLLKLIICLLAVTLFVACSKKKDGNSNPYQGYPYGVTPNEYPYNGQFNNQYPTPMPGYQMNNCQTPSPMFGSLGQYCAWLATEGDRICDPILVRQAFMRNCQSFANQYNYCVSEVRSGCYSTVSGCSYYYKGEFKRYSQYSDRKGDKKRKKDTVYETAPVIVRPDLCIDESRDCKKGDKKKKDTLCKLPNQPAKEEYYTYSLSDYRILANDNCPSQQVQSRPVQQTQPEQKARTVSQPKTLATVVVIGKPIQEKKCMDLSALHKYILDPASNVSSLSILTKAEIDKNRKLSKSFISKWENEVKAEDGSKYRGSIAGQSNGNLSAIGSNVQQPINKHANGELTQNVLIIDGEKGNIEDNCDEKFLKVRFSKPYGIVHVSYKWNGQYGDAFELVVTKDGQIKTSKEQSSFLTERYIGLVSKETNPSKVRQIIETEAKSKGFFGN